MTPETVPPAEPGPVTATAARWKPVTGPTVEERGESHAATYPALYECPVCSAAVPRGSTEKHDEWHDNTRGAIRRARNGPGMIR